MVFTKETLHILTSSKKGRKMCSLATSQATASNIHKLIILSAAALLQELVDPAQQQAGIKLEFLERAKGEDGSTQIQKLVDVLKEQTAQSSVGALPKVRAVDKLLTADSTQNIGAQRGKFCA